MEERKKKIGKLLDSNGMDMSKSYMLDTQLMAEAEYKKLEKEPAPGGICERVADIKTCAQAMKCLTTFSESIGTGFIFEIMSKIMKEHKNLKVLSEGLLWMVFSVDDFGVALLKLKDVFNFYKDIG
ncbi:protein MOR1, partial [Tanacetum coccineum]